MGLTPDVGEEVGVARHEVLPDAASKAPADHCPGQPGQRRDEADVEHGTQGCTASVEVSTVGKEGGSAPSFP